MTNLIGVTGTNGKSTTVEFAFWLLQGFYSVAGWRDNLFINSLGEKTKCEMPLGRLTPEIAKVWFDLEHKQYFIHEVFSLGLQRSYYPMNTYEISAFTSFDREHLHYHGTLEKYWKAKESLFTQGLRAGGTAVIQMRDPMAMKLVSRLSQLPRRVVECGESLNSRAKINNSKFIDDKFTLSITYGEEQMSGSLNSCNPADLWNLEVALGIAWSLDVPASEINHRLSHLASLPGRLQRVSSDSSKISVYIDHSKTERSLRSALQMLREMHDRVYLVLSIGGDRGKFEPIGAVAEALADRIWVTDQTPEFSDMERATARQILMKACPSAIEVDGRTQAIATAMQSATHDKACLLIAGRGDYSFVVPGHDGRRRDVDLVCSVMRDMPSSISTV